MTTQISFTGRTFAVTGGASGMGLSLTIALANLGASVHVADFATQPPVQLSKLSTVFFSGGLDVADRSACKNFIDGIPGRLDGLVNCAGICPAEGKMASDELFARIMAVNSTGTWNMGTEAILRMTKQETRSSPGLVDGYERSLPAGSIINIGSGASLRGIGALAAYCASKHAVAGMTRAWAKDWPSLRINSVAPGVTDTPLVRGGTSQNEVDKEKVARLAAQLASRIPLGRMAYPTDIADVILFLLSDSSSFVTGQVIPVNGGSD